MNQQKHRTSKKKSHDKFIFFTNLQCRPVSAEVADLALLAHLSGHGGRACGSSSSSNSDAVCVLEKDRNPSRLGSLGGRETKFPTFLIRSRSVLSEFTFFKPFTTRHRAALHLGSHIFLHLRGVHSIAKLHLPITLGIIWPKLRINM